MVELNKLGKIAILAGVLAIIVLTLLAVTAGFGKAVRTTTTTDKLSLTGAMNNSLTSYTDLPFVQTPGQCFNATNGSDILTIDTEYVTVEGDSTTGGMMILDAGVRYVGETLNCTGITYLAESDASRAADTFITGMTIFATFMAVVVLAIIGVFIVGLFKVYR